ncbi:hypothetical protein ACN28S_29855 [Cystobacter fuscus]
MNPADTKKYPENAARRLLADVSGRESEYIDQRRTAAIALLSQFANLVTEYKLAINVSDSDFVYLNQRRTLGIAVRADGWLYLASKEGHEQLIKLHYDPIAKRFEGVDEDPDVIPVPGQLRPRRDALAVLVNTALKALSLIK